MELNSPTICRTDNQSWLGSFAHPGLPKFVLISLITAILLLIGTMVRKNMVTKLTGLLDIVRAKNTTGVPSVSTWILLKSFLLYGTGIVVLVSSIMKSLLARP